MSSTRAATRLMMTTTTTTRTRRSQRPTQGKFSLRLPCLYKQEKRPLPHAHWLDCPAARLAGLKHASGCRVGVAYSDGEEFAEEEPDDDSEDDAGE